MPAAGKTTVGQRLAEHFRCPFLDTDELIESRHGKRLYQIIEARGLAGFRQAEEEALLTLDAHGSVIATGGSVVYGDAGMRALRAGGVVVFLDTPLEVLAARVGDPTARGMVIDPGQSFAELFAERQPLYRRYSDLDIDCGDAPPEAIVERVLAELAALELDPQGAPPHRDGAAR